MLLARGNSERFFDFVLLLQNFAQNDKVGKIRTTGLTFTAVLLAGGESRRMGRDKAGVVFSDEPLWRRQLRVLRDLGPEKVFVSARTESSWLPGDTELLLDQPPSRGPLSGLTKALTQMQTSHLVVLAVDMPFVTREQLRLLCSLVTPGSGVVPAIGERMEPLAAIYPVEAVPEFVAALAGNDFSLQGLIGKLVAAGKMRTFLVPEQDQRLYLSLNEPNDLTEGRFPNRPPQDFGGL
jgi:molybdopterin-guanine dinucleotide biosynthesis protein A